MEVKVEVLVELGFALVIGKPQPQVVVAFALQIGEAKVVAKVAW